MKQKEAGSVLDVASPSNQRTQSCRGILQQVSLVRSLYSQGKRVKYRQEDSFAFSLEFILYKCYPSLFLKYTSE